MRHDSKNNTIKFLLDGGEFFRELATQFEQMANVQPSERSYVRLAFWSARADAPIPSQTKKYTLEQLLKSTADCGHPVQVILWDAKVSKAAELVDRNANKMAGEHAEFAKALDGYVGNDQRGKIEVFLESYKGWIAATSTHQKLAIFADEGRLTAVVGGFNLLSSYLDGAAHTYYPDVRDHPHLGGWHDTAVSIEGPATVAIEQEWLRRWKKRYGSRQQPTLPKAPEKQSTDRSDEQVAITILTTNSESLTRETHLRDQLCRDIGKANSYIYLENYGLTDPTLVTALRRRLAEDSKVRVIIMVGQKDHKGEDPVPWTYLLRVAYCKLLIGAGADLEVKGQTLKREHYLDGEWGLIEDEQRDPTTRSIKAVLENRWLENDKFYYRAAKDSKRTLIPLKNISRGKCARVGFYFPRNRKPLYVHSKLALIDDTIAYIGSANFTYRSMAYDGELSARIYGNDAVVQTIRERLFLHYGLDYSGAEDIRLKFGRHERDLGTRYSQKKVVVMPLELEELPNTLPDTASRHPFLNYSVY